MTLDELLTNGYPDGRNYLRALRDSCHDAHARLASRWPYRESEYREHEKLQKEGTELWNHLTLEEKEFWMSEPFPRSWESTPGI
jgi:hypothetical protein